FPQGGLWRVLIDGSLPGLPLSLFVSLHQWPEFKQSGRIASIGLMMQNVRMEAVQTHSGPCSFGKNHIDGLQHLRGGAVGNGEVNWFEELSHIGDLLSE